MTATTFQIEGMTCDHCVKTIQTALRAVPGVEKAEVSLVLKRAVVDSTGPLDRLAVVQAVEAEGYRIVS